uniref:CDP-glycerol glycerophosphotransferase family protein n=1 Tax=Streptomyces sp. GbtcB7 TaxID=2824752 RepID=UPI001C309101
IAALLGDERLREAAESMGGEIVFLPHPNIGAHFPTELIPPHVRMTSYARENVQQLLTSSRVFVTDYSSVAFDAAYADTARA